MEEIKILYRPEVETYLNELILVLFKKEYFSYLENAIVYKDKIIGFIETDIASFPSKKTPAALKIMDHNIFSISQINAQLGMFFLKTKTIIILLPIS